MDTSATGCAASASSTPIDGASKVSLRAPVTLAAGAALDPASVTPATVTLLAPHATIGVPATLQYDASTCRIVVQPTFALTPGAIYRLRASGLTGTDGTPVPDVALRFKTIATGWDRREGIDQWGTVVNGEIHVLDDQVRLVEQSAISSVGGDGQLGTADDHVWYHVRFSYSPDGSIRTWIPDTGTGGDYITSDDPDLPYVTYVSRSPDGMYGYEERYHYDARGAIDAIDRYANAGPDNVPWTSDDPQTEHLVLYEVGPGQREVADSYDIGLDGVWFTDDDELVLWKQTLDAERRPLSSLGWLPGLDGLYDTPDDEVWSATSFTYDPELGFLHRSRRLLGAGVDGIWLTDDDVQYDDYVTEYDALGNKTYWNGYNTGGDKQLGTSDDKLFDRTHFALEP